MPRRALFAERSLFFDNLPALHEKRIEIKIRTQAIILIESFMVMQYLLPIASSLFFIIFIYLPSL
jgi:hypothetical protein